MVTRTRTMSADELLELPRDGFRYELIRGELRKMTPAGQSHGQYAWSVAFSLGAYVEAQRLGKIYIAETGFVLATDPDHVRAPDAAFISNERLAEVGESDGYVRGAPSLAVEVISPSDRYTDVEQKVADWLDAGTLAVVVVDPRSRTVSVHRSAAEVVSLAESDTLEVGDVVRGWQMRVRDIFE